MSKEIQQKRDGRAMLAAMSLGVLGPDAMDARNHGNKRMFDPPSYHGEKEHSGWRSYDARRRECHAVQEGLHLEDPVGYTMNSRSMKRYKKWLMSPLSTPWM